MFDSAALCKSGARGFCARSVFLDGRTREGTGAVAAGPEQWVTRATGSRGKVRVLVRLRAQRQADRLKAGCRREHGDAGGPDPGFSTRNRVNRFHVKPGCRRQIAFSRRRTGPPCVSVLAPAARRKGRRSSGRCARSRPGMRECARAPSSGPAASAPGPCARVRPSGDDITPVRYPTWLHVTAHAAGSTRNAHWACTAPLRHVG